MNTNLRAEFDRLVMLVLDGEASESQHADFDAIIREHDDLRAEYDMHRAIESSLRRFADRAQFINHAGTATIAEAKAAPRARRIVYMSAGIAAAIVLSVSVAAVILLRGSTACSPEAVYDRLVADGLTPLWVCGNNEEFAAYTKRNKGEPLIVARQNPLTEYVGWTYAATDSCTPMQRNSLALMTRHEGQPIVVIVENAQFDQELSLPKKSSLHLHRVQIGKVVLYEVSPFDAPIVTSQLDTQQPTTP